ncbi:hypothetical protein SEA_NORVS_115 [Gordonia phage Norvs]|nr:hypothetical protein SEA_NORVS_115 [Gordonia phage Norvs]
MSDTPTPAEIAAKAIEGTLRRFVPANNGHIPEQHYADHAKFCTTNALAALAEHYHLLPKVEAHRMRVGLIDMAPEDEMFPGDDPVLTVRFSAGLPQPGRLFGLDELAAALMAAHSSEVSNV